jgi:hypothetical protein
MKTQTKKRRMGPKPLPRLFDARILLDLFDEETDDTLIGEALGVGRVSVGRWRKDKQYLLTAYHADRIAIRIGTHPAMLWGRQWWETADE